MQIISLFLLFQKIIPYYVKIRNFPSLWLGKNMKLPDRDQ